MICFSKIQKVVVFIMYLCVWWSTCISSIQVIEANDSLKLGDTLNATTELCSKQSKYCMGFDFHPNLDSKNLTYLRIYPKEDNDWDAWIANRDQPVDLESAVLSLNHSGVLKIESKTRAPIILHSSPQPLNNSNIVATLLDTGNFVVQKIEVQVQPNGMKLKSTVLLWQSFDYPTDSLLPGMKLGVNHKTGHNWSLVSYFSRSIATSGPFRLEWEPKRRELVIKHKEQVYWTSGELRSNNSYKIVSNEDEEYFTLLTTKNKNKGLTIWTLLETGQLINRAGGGDVARADRCYGYKTEWGCKEWGKLPYCRNASVEFEQRTGYPNSKMVNDVGNGGYSINDCQSICWGNCRCVGFRYSFHNGTGCKFLLSMDGFNVASSGSNYYIIVRKIHNIHHNTGSGFPAVHHNTPLKGTKKWIWISAAATLLIICSSILCLAFKKLKYWLKEKKRKRKEMKMLDLAASNESSCAKDLEDDLKEHDIKVFNYTSILEATLNFSLENKLGQGGYGPVYKGVLPTGQQVAVKRLSKTSGQGIMEFKNELTLIGELQHTNLVQLLGCCIHEEEKILVYEYMPNKSLDFYLFDCTRSKFLDWKKRFNIIEGISQGLLYLHKYSRLKVIHRDLKTSNILLDENMNPKISDFGMARIFTQHEPTINTNRIVGTYGYMSPEYAMEGVFSTKSDVYSIGVLLLEIVSGRRNNSFYDDDRPLNLIGYAWELWKMGECLQLMDPSLNDTFIPDEVQRCIHVGLLCTEHYANDRPTMSDIISMLTNKNAIVTLPRRPAFYVGTEILEEATTSMVSGTYFPKEISTSSEVE